MPNIKVETHPVNSSNIKEIGWDGDMKILQVNFWNGAIYQYHPVTATGYQALKSAESVGKYFNENIKENKLLTITKVQDKVAKIIRLFYR